MDSQSVLLRAASDGGDEGDSGGEGRLERGTSHRRLHPRGADVSVAEEHERNRGDVFECCLYALFFYVYDYPFMNAMMRVVL